jgi:tetratricopeptide (TPR) repeat protein
MVALGGGAEGEGWLGRFDLARASGRTEDTTTALAAALRAADQRGNILAAIRVVAAQSELALAQGNEGAVVSRLMARFADVQAPIGIYLVGRTLARAGRVAEAQTHAPRLDAAANPVAPDEALKKLLRAEIAVAQGDHEAAVVAADEAYALERSVLARETQARAFVAAGRSADALRAYEDVLVRAAERTDAHDSPGFHRVVQGRYDLAVLLDDTGDRARAQPHFDQLLSWWANADAADPRVADVRRRLGRSPSRPPPASPRRPGTSPTR